MVHQQSCIMWHVSFSFSSFFSPSPLNAGSNKYMNQPLFSCFVTCLYIHYITLLPWMNHWTVSLQADLGRFLLTMEWIAFQISSILTSLSLEAYGECFYSPDLLRWLQRNLINSLGEMMMKTSWWRTCLMERCGIDQWQEQLSKLGVRAPFMMSQSADMLVQGNCALTALASN